MIIFDLDGTLADCEHRRHFVERSHPVNESRRLSQISLNCSPDPDPNPYIWKPDWKAFYEACDQDIPNEAVVRAMRVLSLHDETQIWSGRCESVREKTVDWFDKYIPCFAPRSWFDKNLKMRPIGDNTPDDQLKERWLDEALASGETIEFVFDDRPKVVRMWRRRGVFVFDCNQSGREF